MLLSQLIHKEIYTKKGARGICKGIGISLKNGTIKYLLCGAHSPSKNPDFALQFTSVSSIDEDKIMVKCIRPVLPKNSIKICFPMPVYAHDGTFLGELLDIEYKNNVAVKIYTTQDIVLPFNSICAAHDAILLRKVQPYPIGQRIPAPHILKNSAKNETLVTRPVLQKAIQAQSLIKLTLSLSPFEISV